MFDVMYRERDNNFAINLILNPISDFWFPIQILMTIDSCCNQMFILIIVNHLIIILIIINPKK